MNNRALVLDANILIRAVLGKRVRELIFTNVDVVQFFAPDIAYADARKYLPLILKKRDIPIGPALEVLDHVQTLVRPMTIDVYGKHREAALKRIGVRDADDWPVLACAMVLGCPVWTEDTDFFGTGIPIWTTDRVNLYFS